MSATQHLPSRQANGSTDQPGGHSAKNARRAGAPSTHVSSQETHIMSTRSRQRQHPALSVPTLTEPPVIEGDCPSRRCQGTYTLAETGQLPEHDSAGNWPGRRCPCSGWLARNPRPRPYFYVQGVRFL